MSRQTAAPVPVPPAAYEAPRVEVLRGTALAREVLYAGTGSIK